MRQRIVLALLTVCLMMVALPVYVPVQAATTQQFFPQTGYDVSGRFLQFWNTNGGLPVFGYPISCEGSQYIQDPVNPGYYTVQWFQRFRLEKHNIPQPYDVLLGRMGFEVLVFQGLANAQTGTTVFPPQQQQIGCRFFGTNQNSCGDFLNKWNADAGNFSQPPAGTVMQKGLALYGNALSDRHMEYIDDPDPNVAGNYDVQWYERARFEYHPKNPAGSQIQGGLLGTLLRGTVIVNCTVTPSARSLANFSQVAQSNGIELDELTAEGTVLYGQGDTVGLIFTPAADLPPDSPDELAQQIKNRDLGRLNRRAIGGLTVVRSTNPDLPPDDYLLTLESDGTVVFKGVQNTLKFPVVIRRPATPLARPVAFVTPFEICVDFTWSACAQIPTPQTDNVKSILAGAANDLGIDGIDTNQAVSLVAGEAELEACANGLKGDQARYDQCPALIFAAPATKDNAFPAPTESGTITAIGLVVLLKDIREEVSYKADEPRVPAIIPAGTYKVYEVTLDTDPELATGVRATRVRLSGNNGDFYLPAVSGVGLLGDVLQGDTTGGTDIAVTTSLIMRGRCFVKVGSCHVQPR
jgi:hypothetical protein